MGVPLSVCMLLIMHYESKNPCHVYHCGPIVFEVFMNFSDLGVLCMSNGEFHDHIYQHSKKKKTP